MPFLNILVGVFLFQVLVLCQVYELHYLLCSGRDYFAQREAVCSLQEHSHLTRALGFWRGEGNGTPLQYSCLENPVDGGAWWAAVHGVTTSRTQLSDFTFSFHFHALEKEMAAHSSVPAWRIPGTAEPGGLPSMGSHRAGHD